MGVKILVVDDEPDLELLITQKFRKKIANKEYEFIFTRNGIQALEMLAKYPDLEIILTDINMPEMDGLTLLAHLSKLNRLYKAVVISAYGDMSNIRSAMNKGASDFVTKPIDFQDLEVTINKIIEQCQNSREGLAAKNRLLDIEKELSIARMIQEAMLPQKFDILKQNVHFELLGTMIPAKQIGGDFFDFFALDETRIGLIIADVSGKSISASLFMAVTKTLFKSVAKTCISTDEAFTKVNQLLSIDNPSCMFVTAFYAILDTSSGKLFYTNAGHTPPFVLSPNDTVMKIGEGTSLPLGLDDSFLIKPLPHYEQKSVTLKDQDCLFLYTDGVTEAMNSTNELYAENRLTKVLRKCGNKKLTEVIDTVLQDIKIFTQSIDQSDDIAILCVRYFEKAKKPLAPIDIKGQGDRKKTVELGSVQK